MNQKIQTNKQKKHTKTKTQGRNELARTDHTGRIVDKILLILQNNDDANSNSEC